MTSALLLSPKLPVNVYNWWELIHKDKTSFKEILQDVDLSFPDSAASASDNLVVTLEKSRYEN